MDPQPVVEYEKERATGLEPASSSMGSSHSTVELRPLGSVIFAIKRLIFKANGTHLFPVPSHNQQVET